jgi:Fe2+ or Zn2+ uptake regulation protein
MERITSQKKIILDYLKSVKTHPSADRVYLAVKKKLPQISQGTVYRILKNFKKKGTIREVCTSVSHYDGDISPHGHFICQDCNNIYDVFEGGYELNLKKIKAGKIKNYQVYLYGVCNKCQKC